MTAHSPLDMFLHWERETPQHVFLRQPIQGQYTTWTYQQAGEEVRKIASGLKALNYPTGSNIALLSKNCAHWIMADLAIMMAGHVSVPLYATLTAHSVQQILEHSGSKAIIIGKLDDYAAQKPGIPEGIQKIGIELYGIRESVTWESWTKTQVPLAATHTWNANDLLTIIYTSGTTGKPKGVMHTVHAFDAVIRTAMHELKLPQHPQMFSYLPLSHIAERMGIELYGIYGGGTFSFAESLDVFAQNLAETQPTTFFAVPRIWAKFQEKILEKLPQKKLDRLLGLPLIGGIVKKSIRKKLGLSRAGHIFSGAAPISVDLLKWFDKLGIRILQAYGMTEDCVYAHFNRPDANKHGTVGKPFKGLQVKISDEGEIRVKSPSNTIGYYKEPGLTAELFDADGFLRTGDKGEIDAEGFLKITGRVKDQFKTDKGKYVSPTPIELKLSSNPDIEQVCVVGMGIPQPIALVVLSAAGKAKPKEQLIQSLSGLLKDINPTLEHYEELKKAVIMKDAWTIENSLLTPTMKVKRNEVEKIHLPKYPTWYEKEGTVVWE
jgi:long-chain acyl-CoA synthetase